MPLLALYSGFQVPVLGITHSLVLWHLAPDWGKALTLVILLISCLVCWVDDPDDERELENNFSRSSGCFDTETLPRYTFANREEQRQGRDRMEWNGICIYESIGMCFVKFYGF